MLQTSSRVEIRVRVKHRLEIGQRVRVRVRSSLVVFRCEHAPRKDVSAVVQSTSNPVAALNLSDSFLPTVCVGEDVANQLWGGLDDRGRAFNKTIRRSAY